MLTPRDQALAAFRKRWKKDAETDGEELPIEQQLENAWKLGWEAGRSMAAELLCPVHASLDARGKLEPFDNCIACIRVQRDELQLQLDMRDAQISMTVARLGGIVEGNPTGRHNFLQRIDQLVANEQMKEKS